MSLFELIRLKREGKDVILAGGFSAIEARQAEEFDKANGRIDVHYRKKREAEEGTGGGDGSQARKMAGVLSRGG